MKKFIDRLGTWIPYVWAVVMITIVTAGGVGISIALVSWVLDLLGVL